MNGGIALMGMVLCGGAVAAPEGFEVGVYSDRVQNATAICFDDQGRLYVTETFRWRKGVEDNRDHTYWIMDDLATETNEARVAYYTEVANERFGDPEYFTRESERVVVMADVDGDGKAEVPTVFAEGFSEAEDGPAIGLLAGEGRILMACVPHVWDLKDADGDGVSEAREKLASGFGVKTSLSGHDLHGLVWGPDGKLYFSMGDRGYNVTTKEGKVLKNTNSGAAFRCDPDGSNLEIFYHNLRNPQEMAFNELGDLITVDNNCDQGDSARVCYLIEGGDAGWNLGAQALTTYSDFIEDGGMEQRPHWLEEGLWKTRHANQPAWVMPPVAHLTNGPSGMLFDSGTSMPERYKNHFLVCDYKGAPNVCFLYSFKLVHAGAGYAMDDGHVFHSGVPNTDVEMGYDGKVYLADFGGGWVRTDAGNIYTVYDPERVKSEVVTGTVALFKSGFDQRAPSELLDLLGHADKRVRQRAQFALVKHGEKARRALASLAARDGELYPRLHAIWGLQQLGAGSDLVALSGDENGEIRAQAVRSIGEIGYAPAKARVRELIGDVVPRVRTFAAMASGKLGDREAMGAVAGLLEKNNNADLYERHAGVFALERLLRDTDLADFKEAVPAVKLGVLLALRRQANPLVAEFLNEGEPALVVEAIRAINDLDIGEAVPALADFSRGYAEGGHGLVSLSDILFRRLINANVRAGKPEHAANLVALASNAKLPEAQRVLCLRALETFHAPQSIDPTMGIYRPLGERSKGEIKAAVEPGLLALFEGATGDVAAGATRVISLYGVRLDESVLVLRVLNSRQPANVRMAALERLAANGAFADKAVFRGAMADSDAGLRALAARLWVERFPGLAMEAVDVLLEQDSNSDKRTAYAILAESGAGRAADERLELEMEKLMDGTLYRTVHLDLYEAAEKRDGDGVKAKLAAVNAWLEGSGRSVFDFTREGGDRDKGRGVFENQGICLKCHKGERGGGDAGPPLTSIARLRRGDEILKSILEPNADIVPGYGTMAVTLKDGSVVTGSPMTEEGGVLVMKAASGEMVEIRLADIEERSAEVSSMVPMSGVLSKQDLRDLMAFLQGLTERK